MDKKNTNVAGIPMAALATAALAAAVLVLAYAAQSAELPGKGEITIRPHYKEGEVLAKLKAPTGLMTYAERAHRLMMALGRSAPVSLTPLLTDNSLYVIKAGERVDTVALLARVAANPQVQYAEPNYIYNAVDTGELGIVPNDPDFNQDWGLLNVGQKDSTGQSGVQGADIGATKAWTSGTGSKNIVVAVIDTGVDYTHPDLANNIYVNPRENESDGKDNDTNGFVNDWHGWNFVSKSNDPMDDNKHGTHVSGTIGAEGGNGLGIAGVSWHVSIMPLKFLSSAGSGSLDDAVDAINYAAMMGVKVINASWGGGGFSQAMYDALAKAGQKGVLFVAAAGNNGSDNDKSKFYPASYELPNVLAVAATDNRDTKASFSNWGKHSVALAAPGANIFSTVPTSMGGYASLSGTSMAAPHVSGAAALLWSLNPNMNAADIKARLMATVDPVHSLSRRTVSGGRLNIYNAVNNIVPVTHEPAEGSWKGVSKAIQSAHPYVANVTQTFQISHPGAKFIRVHFSKVSTEQGYDFVKLQDAKGTVVEDLSGEAADYTSDYVEGESATITFTSDASNNGWGFGVDRYDFVE